jgi:hypothetical protein
MQLAARMLYQRAYGDPPPEPHLDERLNGLAYVLARSGGMYAIEHGRRSPRRVSRDEVASGHFRRGGRELHFLDERAPLVELGVTPACIAKAVDALLTERQKN